MPPTLRRWGALRDLRFLRDGSRRWETAVMRDDLGWGLRQREVVVMGVVWSRQGRGLGDVAVLSGSMGAVLAGEKCRRRNGR